MQIDKIRLKNFRNYESETFEFSNGINVIVGENAQGKTNLAEAVFLLCTGYSPRAKQDKQLVSFGKDDAELFGEAKTAYGKITLEMNISGKENKKLKINGAPIKKMGEFIGNLNGVFFNPQELKLVQEAPEDRRRFLNVSLSQLSRPYYYALKRYERILFQRNNLLKEKNSSFLSDTITDWDKEFSKYAAKIIYKRNEFLKKLSPLAKETHLYLSDNKEVLEIETPKRELSEDEIEERVFSDLIFSYEKDIKAGFTSVGPHRDDIKLTLNNVDVKSFGSQGQQRTVALSIKLAEALLFKNETGEYPVLILDDVLSELDKSRQKRLFSAIDNIQVLLTCTSFNKGTAGKTDFNKIKIKGGKIR